MIDLQPWAKEVIAAYASHASNQFILYGNTQDRMVIPTSNGNPTMGSLDDYLKEIILQKFDIILCYDLGNGITALKECTPPAFPLPAANDPAAVSLRHPRVAIEQITKFFRSMIAWRTIKPADKEKKVAVIIKGANLVVPVPPSGQVNYDLSAMATLIRNWTIDTEILKRELAVFLVVDNLNDLHPMIVNNNRTTKVQISFPSKEEVTELLTLMAPNSRDALANFTVVEPGITTKLDPVLTNRLVGMKAGTIESMLQLHQFNKRRLSCDDLTRSKKELIERDANGLITFMQSERTLDDFTQNPAIRDYLKQDVKLWKASNFDAMPMGYGIFAPVGCGKGFIVECMAGSFGVPFIIIGQFRDKYLGVAEANVERIFRFIDAAAPCVVFIDEMDQSMGKRNVEGDSGVGGRIYSMFATKMADPRNRGKIIWCGATSRPDLVETDLKRPGRLDVKIPLLPCSDQRDAYNLFKSVLGRYKTNRGPILLDERFEKYSDVQGIVDIMPFLLTAGAANALASKVCRLMLLTDKDPALAIKESLTGYQNPVAMSTLEFQIKLAINETTDLSFVPKFFRDKYTGSSSV